MRELALIKRQLDELKYQNIKANYVILDIETWSRIRSNRDLREYIWYGSEQEDPHSPDKLVGLPVAILTNHPGSVIRVVT